jgi:Domain of unknown function (DUF4258)
MKKTRRILLFSIGAVAGCMVVYFSLIRGNNRTYWLPGNRVKDLILKSEIIFSAHAKCMMKCRNISPQDVKEIIQNGQVNFSESNVRNTACPSYAIDGSVSENKKIRIIVTTIDSVAEIETAFDFVLKKDSCSCL